MLAAWRERDQQPPAARRQPSRFPPASAALTAALAATAMTVLTGSDEQAIEQIRALLPPRAGPRRPRPAGLPAAALAAAITAGPRPVPARPGPRPEPRRPDPLPHRHPPGGHPGRPARPARRPRPGDPAAALAGLGDPADSRPTGSRPARSAAPSPRACCCPAVPPQHGHTALHAYRSTQATGAVLRALAGGGHDTVLTAISCLAGYLDTSGSPIDYQRRRDLIPAETITAGQWRDLCYGAAAHPGEPAGTATPSATCSSCSPAPTCTTPGTPSRSPPPATTATTTPSPTRSPPGCATRCTATPPLSCTASASASRSPGHRRPAAAPAWTCPGRSRTTSTWTPPAASSSPAGFPSLTPLPGWAPPAATSGSRSNHVPRPARQWGRSAAPLTWQRRQHARGILTREFFDREYITAGKNLRQLEAETGISRRFLTQVAREHGITMTGICGPAPASPCQLPGQDLTGITGSPAEPGAQSLGDIRRAAQDSRAGWQRLRRFQIAMDSPAIAAAAARLRLCPSALSHQFRRLERDTGAKLYQPATTRRPWRPTGRGAALLTALARPDIQALAAAHAPDVSGRAGSRSRYRDRMPISLGPDAAAARQAAACSASWPAPPGWPSCSPCKPENSASPTWPPSSAAPRPTSPST